MRIYLSSRYSRRIEMFSVAIDLELRGHVITSRWIRGAHTISDSGLSSIDQEKERTRFALEDIEDLYKSDTLITFSEYPHSVNSRGGRHVEFGIALGFVSNIVVVGPRENVFHCLPSIKWFPDYMEFLNNERIWGSNG